MRGGWRTALGLGISVFLLWWVFRGEDFGRVFIEISHADPWLLLAAVGVTTSGFLVRALRWKVLLHPVQPGTSLRSRFAAVNIGFMANNLLPARVGEFARAYALSRMESISVSASFASLVVERFLDAVSLLLLLFVALMSPGFPEGATVVGQPLTLAVRGVIAAVGALLVGIVILLIWPRQIVRLVERAARLLPDNLSRLVIDVLEAFLDGLGVLQRPRLLVLALAWSLGFWAWNSFSFWLGFLAFDIHVGYPAAIFVQGVIALAVAIPSSPGFFGVFHAGAMVGLAEVYGVPGRPTLAFAVGYHLAGFIPVTLIGLYYAWRLGLSLGEVRVSEELVEEAVEEAHPELTTPGEVVPPSVDDGAAAEDETVQVTEASHD